mgnify:CR=1 FL=1
MPVASAALSVSVAVERKLKTPYWKTMLLIGAALVAFDAWGVAVVGIRNWDALYIYPAFFVAWGAVLAAALKAFSRIGRVNALVLFSQMMDASQTFIGVSLFGYAQQMPVVSGLKYLAGAWAIFPLKLGLSAVILYAVDKYAGNEEYGNWIKLAIIILGMPMGFRGMLRVAMGV